MSNINEGNPISRRLANAAFVALALAVLCLGGSRDVRASDNDAKPSKEQKTVISLEGSQQFNPCVSETVTITRGKDVIWTRTQDRPQGGIRIETRDQSEGQGVGDVSYLKYEYQELFDSRTESSETTFNLRFVHRKHLIRQRDNPRNDDFFQREETRLKVVNGVTQAEKNRSSIECK